MQGVTLAARSAIVIPSAPPAYGQDPDVDPHPLIMTAAELRCLRESLGLTVRDLAAATGRHERNVHRWERGEGGLSAENAKELARLVAYTDAAVAALVEAHRAGEPILTYAADADLHAAEPGLWPSLPASWHRAVASRAARETGGRIEYRGAP